MFWARKFKLSDCRECNYIGIHRNDKRHSEKYICADGSERPSRVLDGKNEIIKSFNNKIINADSNKKCLEKGCLNNRSLQHLYRSNAQPNSNEKNYSYSYNDFLRNKRYTNNLPTKKPQANSSETVGFRGSCKKVDGTCDRNVSKVVWKPRNAKFYSQSAVSSSSRLDRLKLDTIRGSRRCPTGKQSGPANGRSNCNGVYVGDKQRNTGFIFNSGHKEINCPQNTALARSRGQNNNNC